jgi:hypothetical protein
MGKRNSKALAAKKSVKEVIKKGQESMDSFKKEVDNDW